jgi:hypothetical protein
MSVVALKKNDQIFPHHKDDFLGRMKFSDNEISWSFSSEPLFDIPKYSELILVDKSFYFASIAYDSCVLPCEKKIYFNR